MNKVILVGRLTKDPDLKFASGSGKAVARFSLAVNRPMKKDEADFINCVAFGKIAETITQYLTKGRQLAITGNIRTGSYEKEGQMRYTTDAIIDSFEFVGNGKGLADVAMNSAVSNSMNGDMTPIKDDDIPF